MYRKAALLLTIVLCANLLFGCKANTITGVQEAPPRAEALTEPTTQPPTEPSTQAATEPETTAATVAQVSFEEYQLTVRCAKLAIHSGPGYDYKIEDYITDKGIYTIVSHEAETLSSGEETCWGKLKSGAGWINLDDALIGESDSYLIKVINPYLPIYSGPGLNYSVRRYIRGGGTYTIVEESIEWFSSGVYITWGKLKSGAGWINLQEAAVEDYSFVNAKCIYCGRSDDSLQDNVCEPCRMNRYEYCVYCGKTLESWEMGNRRCQEHVNCPECGKNIYHAGDVPPIQGACNDCFYIYCIVCGTDCTYRGVEENGMCDDCYAANIPETSPPETSDPGYLYCSSCGSGVFALNGEGICEACAGGCFMCGGPVGDDHNCDDYPNVFCPTCGNSWHTTGVGVEGFHCDKCDTWF